MINAEKIKEKLKEFEAAMTPEETERLRKEAEEERMMERIFHEGEEIAEEEERKMIEPPVDEIHGSPELQEKIRDVNSEECEKDL